MPATFLDQWIDKFLVPQPKGDLSLTWFVSARRLFIEYCKAAQTNHHIPVTYDELVTAIQRKVPGSYLARMGGSLGSLAICGLRYRIAEDTYMWGV